MNPFLAILQAATSIVDKIFPNATEADKNRFAVLLQQQLNEKDLNIAQIEVNKVEAQSDKFFVAGARPFIMWGLGSVLVFYFFLSTIASFAIALGYHFIPMPPLDPMIRDIVLGLLGLGWVSRSYEKTRK